MNLVFSLAIAVLFGAGVSLLVRRDLLQLVVGTVLLSNSSILFLIACGHGGRKLPLLENATEAADPLVQALALTAIVIGFSTTVLLIRVTVSVQHHHESLDVGALRRAESDEETEGA